MLRDLRAIRSDPLRFLERSWRRYGDVLQYPIPRPPTYLVTDPAGVRQVLQGNATNYGKGTIQYSALALVTGDGLLTADTAAWREQRRLVQPAFHHQSLGSVGEHIATAVRRVDSAWAAAGPGAIVDVETAMMRLSLDVVAGALFGTDLAGSADRLVAATLRALAVVVARARTPIAPPVWAPTPDSTRLRRALRDLDEVVAVLIAQRRRRGPTASAPDLLDLLLQAYDGQSAAVTGRGVRDQLVTFIVAGHETVGSALAWAWWLLARHPAVASQLSEEARTVLGDRDPTVADVAALPWTRAVFDEVLRLYPPAWLLSRRSHAADEVAGHRLLPGSLVIISPYLLHRHPAAWPQPQLFDPGRFAGAERSAVSRTAYLPFGAGPRLCIGRELALAEGVLVLAALSRRWRPTALPGQVVRASPVVTIRPRGGMPLRLARS